MIIKCYKYHKLLKSGKRLVGKDAAAEGGGDVTDEDAIGGWSSSSSGHMTLCLLAAGSELVLLTLFIVLNMYFICGM